MPIFIINNQQVNPNVPYAGKLVPADAVPVEVPQVNPEVGYAGKTLPVDQVAPQTFSDAANTPYLVKLGGITLPPDVIVRLKDKKDLVMSLILDGVSVYERILRHPFEIDFEFTVRMQNIGGTNYNNTTPPQGLTGTINNVFPQDYVDDILNDVFFPDSIQNITNSFLNKIGIQQVIIADVDIATVRGSTNVPMKIRCYENVPGNSLIIGSTNNTVAN